MSTLRVHLLNHGLHLVTDAERQRMVTDQLAAVRTRAEKAVLDAVDLVCEGRNGLPTDQITWRPVAEAWRAKQLTRRGEKA